MNNLKEERNSLKSTTARTKSYFLILDKKTVKEQIKQEDNRMDE